MLGFDPPATRRFSTYFDLLTGGGSADVMTLRAAAAEELWKKVQEDSESDAYLGDAKSKKNFLKNPDWGKTCSLQLTE